MRAAMLLLGLGLAACTTGELAGERPAAQAAKPQAAAATAPAAPGPSTTGAGATTQPATRPAPAAALDPVLLTQARVDCWMKVEQQKRLRDIDRRIAFVDKCVADAMKEQ
jgi:hypothetical protein